MAFLRAFVDDSVAQQGDKRLFYAGYLARADTWAEFSEKWDEELSRTPSIEYYKGSGDQFAGWGSNARNAKIAMLAQVISHYQPTSFHFSLNRRLFEDVLKPVSPYGFGRPHFQACFAVMAGVANWAESEGMTTPIEFIFDEQDGVDEDAGLFFTEMTAGLPAGTRKLIASAPWFKSDRDKPFLPLQAADMLAWHLRRKYEYRDKPLPILQKLLNPRGHLGGEVPDEVIENWAERQKTIPGIKEIQTQAQWAKLSREIKRLRAAGIDPAKIKGPGIYYPKGTPFIAKLIDKIRRLFHRG